MRPHPPPLPQIQPLAGRKRCGSLRETSAQTSSDLRSRPDWRASGTRTASAAGFATRDLVVAGVRREGQLLQACIGHSPREKFPQERDRCGRSAGICGRSVLCARLQRCRALRQGQLREDNEGSQHFSPAKTTPRKPQNLREICGTNPSALLCSLVRNEYNGRHATIFRKTAV